MRFMFLGNLIGFPAIVVPTRLGANNLPLAVQVQTLRLHRSSLPSSPLQFMSAPWQEAILLRIAAALESQLPKPPVYYDIF
jgi:Asp-tRNA(Asn)/Glu-tRNA(Gln) amidotransferase A subunit family amidase